MTSPKTYRFTPAEIGAECYKLLESTKDGAVRCRKRAVVTVQYIRTGRVFDWCPDCFVELWDGLPALAEVLQRGVIEL